MPFGRRVGVESADQADFCNHYFIRHFVGEKLNNVPVVFLSRFFIESGFMMWHYFYFRSL